MKKPTRGQSLGDRISVAMAKRGISRGQLAEAMGVTYVAVYCWSKDTRTPPVATLRRLAKILRVPFAHLIEAVE